MNNGKTGDRRVENTVQSLKEDFAWHLRYMLAKYDAALEELNAGHQIEFRGGATEFSGTLDLELYFHTYDVQAADAISRTDKNGLTDHAFEGRSWWFAKDLNHITPFFNLSWVQKSSHRTEKAGKTDILAT